MEKGNTMMKIGKQTVVLLQAILLLLAAVAVSAQTRQPPAPAESVDDVELEQFAEALQAIQVAQQQVQMDMQEAVQGSTMGEERFNEIHESVNTSGEVPGDADEAEIQDYQVIVQELSEIQQDLQMEMATIVEDAGMEVERFNAIVMAIQQDESLWQRVQEVIN